MDDEKKDVELMEVYDKGVIDAIKSRMKRTQLGKFYRQDECISVLSEQIYRFHLGGKSVDEILAFINDELTVVRREDILKVIREHDARPRIRRRRRPSSANKTDDKPEKREMIAPVSEDKPPVIRDIPELSAVKTQEIGSRPAIRSPLTMRTHRTGAGSEESR